MEVDNYLKNSYFKVVNSTYTVGVAVALSLIRSFKVCDEKKLKRKFLKNQAK